MSIIYPQVTITCIWLLSMLRTNILVFLKVMMWAGIEGPPKIGV